MEEISNSWFFTGHTISWTVFFPQQQCAVHEKSNCRERERLGKRERERERPGLFPLFFSSFFLSSFLLFAFLWPSSCPPLLSSPLLSSLLFPFFFSSPPHFPLPSPPPFLTFLPSVKPGLYRRIASWLHHHHLFPKILSSFLFVCLVDFQSPPPTF